MLGRTMTIICVTGLAALVLAACGESRTGSASRNGGSTATTPHGGRVVEKAAVRETEYTLAPRNPRVVTAGVVSFQVQNAGTIIHALEVEGPAGEVKTRGIRPGMGVPLKVDLSKPGTYEWYCPIGDHRARGMKGKITVAGGGSGTSRDDKGNGGGAGGY